MSNVKASAGLVPLELLRRMRPSLAPGFRSCQHPRLPWCADVSASAFPGPSFLSRSHCHPSHKDTGQPGLGAPLVTSSELRHQQRPISQ